MRHSGIPLLVAAVLGNACGSVELKPLPSDIQSSEEALAAALDSRVAAGPVVEFTEAASISSLRGCDTLPDNTASAGEARLAERRHAAGSGYMTAQPNLLLVNDPRTTDLSSVAAALRAQYAKLVLPQLATSPVVAIERDPFTLVYYPGVTGLAGPARVHGRRLRVRVVASPGPWREVVAYYLNDDRRLPSRRGVVFVSAGSLDERPAVPDALAPLERFTAAALHPTRSYAAAMVAHLAAAGWSVLVYDDPGEHLERSLADIRVLDRVLLTSFHDVHLVGSSDAALHFLMFHESPVRSAYVPGTFIPLWTRNDTPATTGGPFGSDRATDSRVIQSMFQWADFALVAARDGVRLGLVANAGGSGIGKAGLFNELLPVLQRFPKTAGLYELRGNDRNGDGVGDRGERCHDGEPADALDFLRQRLRFTDRNLLQMSPFRP